MTFTSKALIVSSMIAVGVGVASCQSQTSDGNGAGSGRPLQLNGAGASFPAKVYQRWFADLAKAGGPQVNYQAVGSGAGRKAFIDQTVNFGASELPA